MKLSVSKKSFRPAEQVFRTFIRSENLGFQWCGKTGEAPPVADQASLFRGRLPISGYKVSADWLEPTVYPFWGYLRAKSRLTAVALRNAPAGAVPHTPFTRKGYAAYRPNRRYAAFHHSVHQAARGFSPGQTSAIIKIKVPLRPDWGSDRRRSRHVPEIFHDAHCPYPQ